MHPVFLVILVMLMTCQQTADQTGDTIQTMAPYVNVSSTHLPQEDLNGLSMDARPADIDGDGDLDIVIANEFRPNIVLINDGIGIFSNESGTRIPSTNHDSEDVGTADFNNDGWLDIVIVSEDDQVNELYLNKGEGFFEDASDRIPVTGTSNAVLVADINNDGLFDILIGNNGQNEILINRGDAEFNVETSTRLPALTDITQDLELGDVDGDGDTDLLVGNEDRNRLLINDGNGIFKDESAERIPFRDTPEETREADFSDIDGDGDLDILFANVQAFVPGADRQNRLLLNDGSGFYKDITSTHLPRDEDRCFDGDFLDIDQDGDPDIITSNSNGSQYREPFPYKVYFNDGTGHFEEKTSRILPDGTVGSGFDVEFADLNGDGLEDLFFCSRGTADLLLFAVRG